MKYRKGLPIRVNKLKDCAVFGLLFLATLNFYGKFFYFAFAAFLLLWVMQRRIILGPNLLQYLCLGLLMAIYNYDEGMLSMIRCFSYAALYTVGYNMVADVMLGRPVRMSLCRYAQDRAYALLTVMAAGSFTHYLLNFIMNLGSGLERNTRDIWTGAIMAATSHSSLACLMLGLAVAMICLPPRLGCRTVGLLCLAVAFAYNLMLAGRTMIVMLLILFLGGLAYTSMSATLPEKLKLLLQGVLTLMLGGLAYTNDWHGVQSKILNSNLVERVLEMGEAVLKTERVGSKLGFLSHALEHPFGGLHLREQFGYAHDLLLDGYDEYGILGFILLSGIVLSGLIALYQVMRCTGYSRECKLALLSVSGAVLLVFCIEPVIEGLPWLFPCYSLINGCLDGLIIVWVRRKQEYR